MEQSENQDIAEPRPTNPSEESEASPSAEELEQPSSTSAPETAPEAAEIPAAPKSPSRMGRILRVALRVAVAAIVLFAAGVATAYFVLYRPTQAQNTQALAELSQARQQLSSAQQDLTTAQNRVKTLQAQTDQAQAETTQAVIQSNLQTTLTDVANARLALTNKDGTAAREAMLAAQNDLGKLLPAVQAKDRPVADAISARLTLALNELSRDPKTALADLDVLTHNLQDLNKLLFE
jgi:hypothetical protein